MCQRGIIKSSKEFIDKVLKGRENQEIGAKYK
jgi:hypothetical protein